MGHTKSNRGKIGPKSMNNIRVWPNTTLTKDHFFLPIFLLETGCVVDAITAILIIEIYVLCVKKIKTSKTCL